TRACNSSYLQHECAEVRMQGHPPRRTVLITAPTNRTVFEVMITQFPADLHALDPSTRLLPRN
ncbi:MAG: hypothetical protein OXK19_06370, partial [Candidatus Dadabacteria bacterium]|nr:hypothetical protein [Candidatus Dadabacteria bacterium]